MYMFFWFFKQLYYCLRRIFKSGILLLIVFFIAFLFIFVKPTFASSSVIEPTTDIYNELLQARSNAQNNMSLFIIPHLVKNDSVYINYIKPILDEIIANNYDLQCGYNNQDDYTIYVFNLYHKNYNNGSSTETYQSRITNNTYTIPVIRYDNMLRYTLTYNRGNNTYSVATTYVNYTIPHNFIDFRTELMIKTLELAQGGSDDYSGLLIAISQYLNSIDNTDTQILSNLNLILSALNTIINTSPTDYTNQISSITNKVEDILTDNQTLISQNEDMLEQQEQINSNLENLEDTITNSNIDNSSINLPTDNSNDITQEGLNSIFTIIYNAFCVGQPQDIIFPIPFTNKNITLKPNYVREMLTNSGANWVILIIEAFWWYLISRFIIKDITNKITKIKSGNIENIENTNIKGDML